MLRCLCSPPVPCCTCVQTSFPELDSHQIQETDLRSRAKYLRCGKDVLWSRWTKEYLRGIRERHRRCGGEQTSHRSVGDVVIIKDGSWNRNMWKLRIVQNLIVRRDGIVRAAKPRVGSGEYQRAVQQLHPLELSVDLVQPKPQTRLNPTLPPFRPRRSAAVTACRRIQEIAQEEQEQ